MYVLFHIKKQLGQYQPTALHLFSNHTSAFYHYPYEVVLVWSSTPAGGQSGPIVFPCVPGSRLSSSGVKKTTNSGDPDGCVQHELLPSNLFILRGRAWYYNVLNELPGWSLLSLYDDFIQKQTLCMYVQLLCFHIFEQINPLLYW